MFIKLCLELLFVIWSATISTCYILHVLYANRRNASPTLAQLSTISTNVTSTTLNSDVPKNIQLVYDDEDVPLPYILSNYDGYEAFLQHCINEINGENLLFLANICNFKMQFLDRLETQFEQNIGQFAKQDITVLLELKLHLLNILYLILIQTKVQKH